MFLQIGSFIRKRFAFNLNVTVGSPPPFSLPDNNNDDGPPSSSLLSILYYNYSATMKLAVFALLLS